MKSSQQLEKEQTPCSSTNHIYQNIQKEPPKEKIWTIPFLLESPKSKNFQPPDLEIDFSIDSGAESNIINIPTWNEIKIIGIPFITKYIPTISILDSKIIIKDKYTKMQNTALTFFQRMNKHPPFFPKI